MFLLLSGEGVSDIGTQSHEIGPMTKFVDTWIARRSGYSIIDIDQYMIVAESTLSDKAKSIKSLSRKGKRQSIETRYFYKNARALALFAKEENQKRNLPIISILFRDADGTVNSDRGEWEQKRNSMLKGFEDEEVSYGVPMIPKPKSEAWLLCALRNDYQSCEKIENESGNDKSPNALKKQLEEHLGKPSTRIFLNEQIDQGKLDINKIIDMPSLTAFKSRLDEVLDEILPSQYKNRH